MSDWRSRALRPLRRDTTGHRGAQAEAPERSMAPRTDVVSAPVEESVVDAGLYVDSKRVYSPAVLSDTFGYLDAYAHSNANGSARGLHYQDGS